MKTLLTAVALTMAASGAMATDYQCDITQTHQGGEIKFKGYVSVTNLTPTSLDFWPSAMGPGDPFVTLDRRAKDGNTVIYHGEGTPTYPVHDYEVDLTVATDGTVTLKASAGGPEDSIDWSNCVTG